MSWRVEIRGESRVEESETMLRVQEIDLTGLGLQGS
jgi:hypothetical protein